MKIFITGIAGFLGSHLAELLISEGHTVAGNDTFICGDIKNLDGIEAPCFEVDCCDYNAMRGVFATFHPDVVVHCAATAHEGLSTFSPSFITRNIYEASVSVFSAAIASGVKRIVYMSSMSRYGTECRDANIGPPFEEWFVPNPVDPYGIAKVAAEDTLKVLCKTHEVAYSILVPHNIIGIRQRSIDPFRNVAAIMINRCKQGKEPIIYGDGSQTRCFSPIADCLPSIVKAIHGKADGEVVNIGPDSNEISVKQLADKIIAMTDARLKPIHMPDRPNEVKHAYCSSDKARQLLGYEPRQKLEYCLMEMCDYIQPEPFSYKFPLEIETDKTPETWKRRLM